MDIKKLADVKDRFADYEKIFNSGDYDKAADILSAILERIEECTDERKAGTMDDTFVKKSDMDTLKEKISAKTGIDVGSIYIK